MFKNHLKVIFLMAYPTNQMLSYSEIHNIFSEVFGPHEFSVSLILYSLQSLSTFTRTQWYTGRTVNLKYHFAVCCNINNSGKEIKDNTKRLFVHQIAELLYFFIS